MENKKWWIVILKTENELGCQRRLQRGCWIRSARLQVLLLPRTQSRLLDYWHIGDSNHPVANNYDLYVLGENGPDVPHSVLIATSDHIPAGSQVCRKLFPRGGWQVVQGVPVELMVHLSLCSQTRLLHDHWTCCYHFRNEHRDLSRLPLRSLH